jgi:DNA replication protein DnaC
MATNQKFTTRENEIRNILSRSPHINQAECEAYLDNQWLEKKKDIKDQIPDMYKNSSFYDFDKSIVDQVMCVIYDILSNPKGDKTDKMGLILHGPVGSGKTRMAYAIINYLIEIDPEMASRIENFSVLMKKIRKEIFSTKENEFSIWDVISNENKRYSGFLLLDDLASKSTTDFESDTFLQLLEARVNNYHPMIITTNIDKSELENVFGERIASRLVGNFHFIEIGGVDNRVNV